MMRTLDKHIAAINAGTVTKTNVIGIRKAINTAERTARGYSNGRTSPAITVTEALELRRLIMEREPRVSGELHDSGLKVLRNPRYAKRWSDRERAIINYSALSFRLANFDLIGRDGMHAVPVYRAIGDDRMGSFLFRNIPWQSAWVTGEESGPTVIREIY